MSTVHYLVGFLVVVLAVRADERQFYLRHVEFTRLVVATDGNALIARYTEDPATDALMFKEDPRTQNIITVDGELCITDDSGDSGTPPSDIISYISTRQSLSRRDEVILLFTFNRLHIKLILTQLNDLRFRCIVLGKRPTGIFRIIINKLINYNK